MKASAARKFIGKRVRWLEPHKLFAGYRYGVVLGVEGKNLYVNEDGIKDWRWLPDISEMVEAPEPSDAPSGAPQHVNSEGPHGS